MKLFLIPVFLLVLLGGCAIDPRIQSPYGPSSGAFESIAAQRSELGRLKNQAALKRQQLKDAKLLEEIEQMKKEIHDLQSAIDGLEDRIARAEATEKITATPTVNTSSGGNIIGPRGGCYKITKSGKKNYGAC